MLPAATGAAALSPSGVPPDGVGASTDSSESDSQEDYLRETITGGAKPLRLASTTSIPILMQGRCLMEVVSIALVSLSMFLTTALTLPEVEAYVHDNQGVGEVVHAVELALGVAFAVEFVGRTIHAHFTEIQGSWSYICSWEGCVDGMAAASILADLDSLSDNSRTVNFFWLLRLFRVLKFLRYLREMNTIASAVAAEKKALFIFMLYVFLLCFMFGTVLFYLEEGTEGFASIPASVWCIIVTITTVGYGDMVPQSIVGRFLICFVMLLGYSTLAVPTIVGVMDVFGGKQNLDDSEVHGDAPSFKESTALRLAESAYMFTTRMPLRPWDCDRWGFLNSVTYHQIFEAAVFDFFSQHTAFNPGRATRPMTVRVACEVLAPLSGTRAGGDVVVGLSAVELSAEGCQLALGLFAERGGPLRATGDVRLRWVRASTYEDSTTSARIPPDVRSALEGVLVRMRPE